MEHFLQIFPQPQQKLRLGPLRIALGQKYSTSNTKKGHTRSHKGYSILHIFLNPFHKNISVSFCEHFLFPLFTSLLQTFFVWTFRTFEHCSRSKTLFPNNFSSWTLFVPFQNVPTRRTTPTTKPLLGLLSVARGQKKNMHSWTNLISRYASCMSFLWNQ